jgi:DNA-binding GntR family transcriptional regulator
MEPATPDEDETMTNPELIKVAAIKAILEAIEEGDEEDAKAALKMVKALLGADSK